MQKSRFTSAMLLLIITASLSFAQNPLKQGVYTIGGSASFMKSTYKLDNSEDKFTYITLAPTFGYFVTNNIMINGRLGFSYYESEYTSGSGQIYKGYSREYIIGVGARYYFDAETFVPFLGINANYAKRFDPDTDGRLVGFLGGINYFLSKEVALEPFISYEFSSTSLSRTKKTTLSFGIGVNYYITD